ncbi:hypothetical protein P8A21_28285 [Streptomyces poriferorum]|uniref:hypothetical protein n=1 Tax=Streptomyces TaxID=1883 RepID=UPI00273EC2C4|nr:MULTISPECIES: hypothetical protein [unclassified Streptomyces]WLQ51145.1 hypothetical protein P8A21_28285 [Streptomyces sp. Alt1]WSI65976.1 hypothetical protein OG471_29780 [Streptomyces sp. NBC_01336]
MNSTTPTTPTTPTDPVAEGDGEANTAERTTAGKGGAKTAGNTTEQAVTDAAATGGTTTRLEKAGPESGADAEQDLDREQHADDLDLDDDESHKESSGLGTAAAAVVSVGLGIVSLSGAWSGRVAAERETLIGQFKTSSGATAAQQVSEIYGDAWHATALVNGLFGLLALLVGVYVLVRPAFGAPSAHPQPGWIRAVAKGGIALGVLGVLIAVCMYFDLIVALPTAPATAG